MSELANPSNNELLNRFYHDDAHEVMSEFGLTDGEQAIVLSGDLELLQAALDSASIAADFQAGSAVGIVATYTPPPRPAPQGLVATFD